MQHPGVDEPLSITDLKPGNCPGADSFKARNALRAATEEHHRRVDAAFGGFDLKTREGYCRFLLAQAGAFIPVEAGIDRAPCDSPVQDWSARRRTHLLLADLGALDLQVEKSFDAPIFENAEAVLGATYVLEGSRLGASVLARSVSADLPQRFIRTDDPGSWRRLIAVLDTTLIAQPQVTAAIDAARAVFTCFEASARRYLQAHV